MYPFACMTHGGYLGCYLQFCHVWGRCWCIMWHTSSVQVGGCVAIARSLSSHSSAGSSTGHGVCNLASNIAKAILEFVAWVTQVPGVSTEPLLQPEEELMQSVQLHACVCAAAGCDIETRCSFVVMHALAFQCVCVCRA